MPDLMGLAVTRYVASVNLRRLGVIRSVDLRRRLEDPLPAERASMAAALTCSFRLVALPPCRHWDWAWFVAEQYRSGTAAAGKPPSVDDGRALLSVVAVLLRVVLLRRQAVLHAAGLLGLVGLVGLVCSGLVWSVVEARPLFPPSARSGVACARTLLRWISLQRTSLQRILSLPHRTAATPRTPARRGIRYSRIANGRRADRAAGMIASHRCAY